MAKQKHCYAIVNQNTGQLLLEDGKLPIYWNKKVAQEMVKRFNGFCIEPVLLEELRRFILTHPY